MRSSKSAKPKTSSPATPLRRTPISGISPDEQIVGAPFLGKVRAYDAKKGEMTIEEWIVKLEGDQHVNGIHAPENPV